MNIIPIIVKESIRFKYIMLIPKTTSKIYPFILRELQSCSSDTFEIEKQLWHVVYFDKNYSDLKKFTNLLAYTENIKNVTIYKDDLLVERGSLWLSGIVNCAAKANNFTDTSVYCCEREIRSKEKSENPHLFRVGISADFDKILCKIAGKEYKKPKFIHIQGVRLVNPCHQISSFHSFNPYQAVADNIDIIEYYKAFAIKKNHAIFDCPFFDINNFKCDFIDTYTTET